MPLPDNILPAEADLVKLRPVLDAIRQQETGHLKDPEAAVGDHGLAIGPYQIHKIFWDDAEMPYGHYEDVRDPAYAEKVAVRVWYKYRKSREALRKISDSDTLPIDAVDVLARTFNGGPGYEDKGPDVIRRLDKYSRGVIGWLQPHQK